MPLSFRDKVLDGINASLKELGLEPYFITPEISDPIAYVIGQNERRRQLTSSQRAVIAEQFANLKQGSNRYQQKVEASRDASTLKQVSKLMNTSKATVDKVRHAKRNIGQHAVDAIKDGKISAEEAYQIGRLPKNERQAAFETAIIAKRKREPKSPRQPKADTKPQPKLQWTPEEEAENKACLAIINAPSTFPKDAPISQSINNSEAKLREDIMWLREREGKIASFNSAQVFEMQLRTNGVQAYKVNFPGFARPDGEIDQRLLDWASDLWKRQRRQERRLELLQKLRPARKKKEKPSLEHKTPRSFGDRFRTFWIILEDSLGRLFKPSEHLLVIRSFKREAKQFFSDLSAENRGTAVVADAQKQGSED
jgi:hypothetical protein